MELELGLAPPDQGRPPAGAGGKRKRRGVGACGGDKPTLPLFVRGGGDDDDGSGGVVLDDGDRELSSKRKKLVGWPPVKCARRQGGGGVGRTYVKVRMEGVAIGRKVDVSLHGSYDELLRALGRMFPSSAACSASATTTADPYVVTYEDGDGDWLLVGDVPWEEFASSVKRLMILA